MSAVSHRRQSLDLASDPVGSVSCQQHRHQLGIESNPSCENGSLEMEAFTDKAFNPSQQIEVRLR
jgi:hypothetical protein